MGVASVLSWAIAPLRMLQRPEAQWPSSLFLAYVGLMSFTAAVYGVRILGQKARTSTHPLVVDYVPAIALVLATVLMAAYSCRVGFTLGLLFSGLGLLTAVPQLKTLSRAPQTRRFWLEGHIGAMLIACIATLTAFLVNTAGRFTTGSATTVMWFVPTVVLVPLMIRWQRKPPPVVDG